MNPWPPTESLRHVDLRLVGDMAPQEVLYEFERPCIFTTLAQTGHVALAYLSEKLDARVSRFVVATTSGATIEAMKDGLISVREALERGSLWLVDVDDRKGPVRAFAVDIHELPDDALPGPATMLWPELQRRVRAIVGIDAETVARFQDLVGPEDYHVLASRALHEWAPLVDRKPSPGVHPRGIV